MDILPTEAFQLICSFCSLYSLSRLRLVSKEFRDRVDGSLTSRRQFAGPSLKTLATGKHDRTACYIRLKLKRGHEPLHVVFNGYNPEHNYLEFVQRSKPVWVDGPGFMQSSWPPVLQAPHAGQEGYQEGPLTVDIAQQPQQQQQQQGPGRDEEPVSDFTMGQLDLNLWEVQRETETEHSRPRRASITQASTIRGMTQHVENELVREGPITTLSQAGLPRTNYSVGLGSLSSSSSSTSNAPPAPAQDATASALTSVSLSAASTAAAPARESATTGDNYMVRFAKMLLRETGLQRPTQSRAGMSAEELAREAYRLMHTVEPEILASTKQYRFDLSEGEHFIGDSDFLLKYTMVFEKVSAPSSVSSVATSEQESSEGEEQAHGVEEQQQQQGHGSPPLTLSAIRGEDEPFQRLLTVKYVRVSWKWITASSTPTKVKARQAGVNLSQSLADPDTRVNPLPSLRVGGIYPERFNRVLEEIRKQNVQKHIRGELAILGYDASILPRDYFSVNMRAEPILAWVVKEEEEVDDTSVKGVHALERAQLQPMEIFLDESFEDRHVAQANDKEDAGGLSDSDWEDLAPTTQPFTDKGKVTSTIGTSTTNTITHHQQQQPSFEELDRAALSLMVHQLEDQLGHLTVRNLLEEMLADRGYSRHLVWKYGFVRREMMDPVPVPNRVNILLKKIVMSEGSQ